MAQTHSVSDTLAHATPALDQRTSADDTPQTTAQEKNSLNTSVDNDLPPQPNANPEEVSKKQLVDENLEAEDAAEVAKKDAAKAQSAAAHGKSE